MQGIKFSTAWIPQSALKKVTLPAIALLPAYRKKMPLQATTKKPYIVGSGTEYKIGLNTPGVVGPRS